MIYDIEVEKNHLEKSKLTVTIVNERRVGCFTLKGVYEERKFKELIF
jgi:hypothetical protein